MQKNALFCKNNNKEVCVVQVSFAKHLMNHSQMHVLARVE